MQLHPHVQAQRSATIITDPRFCPGLQLSVTLDTLPPGTPVVCDEITPGHWLVVVRDHAEYDEVAFSYVFGDRVPTWIARRLYMIYGMPSPAVDLAGYRRLRWWAPDWPVTTASVSLLEGLGQEAGLVTQWPHTWLTPVAA